jgi:hypothetical protein
MKGNYGNNSILRISVYKLYYDSHDSKLQSYILSNYSFNDKDNLFKSKFIDIKI